MKISLPCWEDWDQSHNTWRSQSPIKLKLVLEAGGEGRSRWWCFLFYVVLSRLCIPFCIPFLGFPVPGILGNYFQVPVKKGIPFHGPFFPRVTFQEFLFAGTMFLQKTSSFLPLLPKRNNSPACRPKMSKKGTQLLLHCPGALASRLLLSPLRLLLSYPSGFLVGCYTARCPNLSPSLVAPLHPSC